jgi:hypothetical protein
VDPEGLPYATCNRESRDGLLNNWIQSWIRVDSEKLKRQSLGTAQPAISNVHPMLDRHGLISRGRLHYKAEGTLLSPPTQPMRSGARDPFTAGSSGCQPTSLDATSS